MTYFVNYLCYMFQALKTAQKQIDKVLDIEESEANRGKTSVKTGKSAPGELQGLGD